MSLPPIIFQKHVLLPTADAAYVPREVPRMDLVFSGVPLTAFPHEESVTKVLRNVGHHDIQAPVQVPGNYIPRGRFNPYSHQWRMAGFATIERRGFILSGMGSGKTSSVLWAADYMMTKGLIKSALIVAPLSCLRRVWQDEVFTSVPGRSAVVVHGSREQRRKALETKADFYIINHDGVTHEREALLAMSHIGLVVVDEFTAFKSKDATRSKALRDITRKDDRRLLMMSATPAPQSPLDAYFPCTLVNPNTPNFGRFKESTMAQVSKFKWVPRYQSAEVIRGLMQPAILFRKEDVLDLPPLVYVDREADLTPEQVAHRKSFKSFGLSLIQSNTISAANAAVLAGKLLQIAQGVLIGVDGEQHFLDCAPRLAVLDEVVDNAQGKFIVFAPFKATVKLLHQHLSKRFRVEAITGDVSEAVRSKHYMDFQQSDALDGIIAHPKTMSHGLTLTAADVTAWYGPTTSTETYLQANQRMDRPGQKRSMTIAKIGATPEEWAVYKALQTNTNIQSTLLELFDA